MRLQDSSVTSRKRPGFDMTDGVTFMKSFFEYLIVKNAEFPASLVLILPRVDFDKIFLGKLGFDIFDSAL